MVGVVPPVGHEHAVPMPLAARNIRDKLAVFARLDVVDMVIGAHDRHRVGVAHHRFERADIQLPQRPLGNAAVGFQAFKLRVVGTIVLEHRADAARLCRADDRRSINAAEIRILRGIGKVSAAAGVTENIDSGRQPQIHAAEKTLLAHRCTVGGVEILVK